MVNQGVIVDVIVAVHVHGNDLCVLALGIHRSALIGRAPVAPTAIDGQVCDHGHVNDHDRSCLP
jgi:hypothetical protein